MAVRRIVIRNMSDGELRVMLEPTTEQDDVEIGKSLSIEAKFKDHDFHIDIHSDNFISVWSPPGAVLKKV